jgi:hypothetical protein
MTADRCRSEACDPVAAWPRSHALGMSRPNTRKSAGQQASGHVASTGRKVDTAVFDTRLDKAAWLTGSAARRAAARVKRLGMPLTAPPASFIVTAAKGPLADGEPGRAHRWSETIRKIERMPLLDHAHRPSLMGQLL